MKITLASVLLLCLFTKIVAQTADSLEVVILKTKADSTKTMLWSLLADEMTKSNPLKAVQCARAGLTLATAIGFEKGMSENYFSLATAFQGQALFDSAIYYFHRAHTIGVRRADLGGQAEACSALGHSFMRKSQMDSARFYLERGLSIAKAGRYYRIEAGIYNNYGNVFLEESNYQKALDYFIQAARLYENPLSDEYGQCLALSNIGNIEYRLGNYKQAFDYAHQSMAIAKRKELTSMIGYAHKLLGRIYRKQMNYDSALHAYQQAQKIYFKLGDKRSVAEVLLNIGNIYYDKEQYQQAELSYRRSLPLAKRISIKPLIASAYSCIGMACASLKKNDEALLYLDSSRVAAQAIGNPYLVMDSYEVTSSVYEAKGDHKKALAVHRKFVVLKDSITQSQNRRLSEETQAKYELEKKEAQIALLEKDQALKNLALDRHQARLVGAAVALMLVVIIALLLINRYRLSNQAKRTAEIERVRNTIARDLHDDIGSTLSTINIISKLAMHENPGNSTHLNHIAEQSSRMMESMTDMVWSINPVNDSMEKVLAKMNLFTGEILEPKNISYRFSGEEALDNVNLDAEKRKNLFLIFKEAINNAAKYSGGSGVDITLERSGKMLMMTVSDNGQGFDRQHVKHGNGLQNMEARAVSMGAHFKLTSALNQGTQIVLALPIT